MKLIYQSKRTKILSTPVGEHDTLRRSILERAGWQVVERIEDEDEAPTPVTEAAQPEWDDIKGLTEAQVDALQVAGFETPDDIRQAEGDIDDLNEINGIGPATVDNIRNWLNHEQEGSV